MAIEKKKNYCQKIKVGVSNGQNISPPVKPQKVFTYLHTYVIILNNCLSRKRKHVASLSLPSPAKNSMILLKQHSKRNSSYIHELHLLSQRLLMDWCVDKNRFTQQILQFILIADIFCYIKILSGSSMRGRYSKCNVSLTYFVTKCESQMRHPVAYCVCKIIVPEEPISPQRKTQWIRKDLNLFKHTRYFTGRT